ncbi:hypothetical protein SAMN05216480_10354 [Pustulibacterium marinum]|uniref:Lipocalin-like domain-containing protein n=1 Tax=Pustulibacterium marinum TaxID=1224947 RepID=A0A1I7G1N3_9FLAO|nr:hypothetical protein [Pustulibacterium marinum]SFU42221.1 hypothetical protein SAMN05216480_10354 [Pustulibacterium marinum]
MKKIGFLLALAVLMVACTLSSQYSLSGKEPVLPMLLGTWHNAQSTSEIVHIKAFDKETYQLSMLVNDSLKEGFKAHTNTINDQLIFTIEPDNEKQRYGFYMLKIWADSLKMYEITSPFQIKLGKDQEDFKSEKKLKKFLKKYTRSEAMYDDEKLIITLYKH